MEPLKEGETTCPVCNGSGRGYSKVFKDSWINCGKCNGFGKLDWVEMVVGKKRSSLKPGIYIKEIDLSKRVPNFEQSVKEIREAIIEDMEFQKSF